MANKNELLRNLPSVDSLLETEAVKDILKDAPRKVVVQALRDAIDLNRSLILKDSGCDNIDKLPAAIIQAALSCVGDDMKPYYRRIINATGIILHTALGRAVLAERALDQIQNHLRGYNLLQMDLATGKRSSRDGRLEALLQRLTGCEAATVVNNNAAATAIALNSMAAGKEVIVSRGQLVEIGGAFRLPEVMEAAGVKMVEVGTTNKTHPRDYENAITEDTAAIIRVHPSNYQITGFTSEVSLETLIDIAHRHNLVMIDDVGAGALFDFSRFGFQYEPPLPVSIQMGADLVTCSADKLIGGPQGGIILGKAEHIQKIRKSPWARILRVDKLTLALLEATLTLFLDEQLALAESPTLRMLGRTLEDLTQQANRIAKAVNETIAAGQLEIIDGFSQMGSGSLPTQNLPTKLLAIKPAGMSLDELTVKLRQYPTPIVARISEGQLLMDPRTMLFDDEEIVVKALVELLGN
ncbi:MAG: L-seryl-tRNA(Sec) selenium transferase [Phycisphaerae bacterium]|nr:L-seryl-tRNA(Sec) selenium transferase [Phycisphaerae bacterium]